MRGVVQTRSPMLSRRMTRMRECASFPGTGGESTFMRVGQGTSAAWRAFSDAPVSGAEIEQSLAQGLFRLDVEPLREELQQLERPVAMELARDPAHAREHLRLARREDI